MIHLPENLRRGLEKPENKLILPGAKGSGHGRILLPENSAAGNPDGLILLPKGVSANGLILPENAGTVLAATEEQTSRILALPR